MPVTDHLAWNEIRDFRPGLWTASPHLMPPQAAQQMDNCAPNPGGGLRAFYRVNPNGYTATGLPGTKRVRGFHVDYQVQQPAAMTVLTSNPLLMLSDTAAPSQGFALYELDRRTTTGAPWVLRRNFANGTAGSDLIQMSQFAGYRSSSLGDLTAFTANLPPTGTADEGVWYQIRGAAAPVLLSADRGVIAAHQSRLIVGRGSTLKWTAPGGTTFTNTLELAVGQPGANIAWMVAVAPSDLFVGMLGGQLYNIQGDLGALYQVRELGRFQASGLAQAPPYTPYGIALMASWDGAYLLSPGGQSTHISRNIEPSTWAPDTADAVSMGQPVFTRDMTFFPRGLVYDHATESWFKLPAMEACMYLALDNTMNQEKVVGVTTNATPSFPAVEFATTGVVRATDFTWKSAPIRDPSGRAVQVREIQLVVQAYGDNETLTVTVNGFARTLTLRNSGRQAPRFLFREEAPELDITVRSQTAVATEAPTIEAVRFGTRPGHLLTTGATLESLNTGKWDVSEWDSGVVWA